MMMCQSVIEKEAIQSNDINRLSSHLTSGRLLSERLLSIYFLSLLSNTLPARLEARAPARRVACAARPTCVPSITAATPTRASRCCDCPATLTNTRVASSRATRSSTWARTEPRCPTESSRTTKGRRNLCQSFRRCFEGNRRIKVRHLEPRTRLFKRSLEILVAKTPWKC